MLDKKEETNKKIDFLKYHLPVILYALIIIFISSLTHLKIPQIRFLAFDKITHFFEYGIFAFLTVRSFKHISQKITKNSAFLFTALFIVIFAIFDEYLVQSISHRTSSAYDLLADVFGAFLLLAIFWLFKEKK